jgi:murein DD-endopeptidase MepM/ murein hydrolase activator NlpD
MLMTAVLAACQTAAEEPGAFLTPTVPPTEVIPSPTPFVERPNYAPGELVEYIAQTGDTLPALAAYFHTTVAEIREANPVIPADATTMPPGFPMQIPIYYAQFWGSPYQIIPDSRFVNGPSQVDFNTADFVNSQNGWLRSYRGYIAGQTRTGAEMVDYVASNFSVSPQLLLALLEYQLGALTQPESIYDLESYPLGHNSVLHRGLYPQLVWAANTLNNGYYRYRTGDLATIEFNDGTFERPDPWQNAATVALMYYFSLYNSREAYALAIGPDGLAGTFQALFGDPWANDDPHVPGSLRQPDWMLPFEDRKTWAFTGGPHTGWGTGAPAAAIDFAPPSVAFGCVRSDEWATAMADGVIIRSETGLIELDLDMDGDTRTGWVVMYLHVATEDRPRVGDVFKAGDRLAHPSCEGGTSTGTHVHLARKYNGEWIPAGEGPLAWTMEGWVVEKGVLPYQGTLRKLSDRVTASENANSASLITAVREVTP